MVYSAEEIAGLIDGTLVGDGAVLLQGFAPAHTARAGDLTFAENEEFFEQAKASAAAAILVDQEYQAREKVLIRVPSARVAFAQVLPLFFPEANFSAGIHPSSVVSPSAQVDPSAYIGPHCSVEDQARIGARSVIQDGSFIGAGCVLGEEVRIFPRVTIYPGSKLGSRVRIHSGSVIGADGFGYVLDQGRHVKIPQVGDVIIGDDVEIGAGVTVDRGALGSTCIGSGSKIDNLVQIAHNVVIGEHCILVSQVGIAGSTCMGDYVTLAGQVGVAGHLKIGSHVIVGAKAGVMHDIPDGEQWLGAPAQKSNVTKRQVLAFQRLPDLLKRVAALESRLE